MIIEWTCLVQGSFTIAVHSKNIHCEDIDMILHIPIRPTTKTKNKRPNGANN